MASDNVFPYIWENTCIWVKKQVNLKKNHKPYMDSALIVKMVNVIGAEETQHKTRISWQRTEGLCAPGGMEAFHFCSDDADSNPDPFWAITSLGLPPSAVKHE